jgi:hypothetical protein
MNEASLTCGSSISHYGQIGEVIVSAITPEVTSSTPLEDILHAAKSLAEKHRDAIEAPLP